MRRRAACWYASDVHGTLRGRETSQALLSLLQRRLSEFAGGVWTEDGELVNAIVNDSKCALTFHG